MGTTSEKLVYLNDTKVLIRNKLNKFGAELTNENTFRSYATFLEDLYNDYPTVSDVGSTITVNNTKKAPLKKLDLNSIELTQDGTPTPDNPVDVNVITGSNNINITNTRNLLDFSNITVGKLGTAGTVSVEGNNIIFTANNQSVYGIGIDLNDLNLKPNTTYTVSNLYENTGSFSTSSGWRYYDGTSYTVLAQAKTYFNFTTGDGTTNKLYFYLGSPTTYTGTLTLYNIQLLEGTILQRDIPTYIPYSQKLEQNYPINLGELEYCEIGDYADQIFKNTIDSEFYDSTLLENEWYLKKNIGKVVLNGSENWASVGTFSGFYGYYLILTNAIHVGQDASPLFKSDKFHYVNGTSQANEGGAYMVARNFLIFVTENTVSDLKTWLSNHNTIVYYILETPTYIHISETDYPILRSQLENLYNNAKSYNEQTNITQTNDGLPFNISASALMKGE